MLAESEDVHTSVYAAWFYGSKSARDRAHPGPPGRSAYANSILYYAYHLRITESCITNRKYCSACVGRIGSAQAYYTITLVNRAPPRQFSTHHYVVCFWKNTMLLNSP